MNVVQPVIYSLATFHHYLMIVIRKKVNFMLKEKKIDREN